jgi:hypothetical protein
MDKQLIEFHAEFPNNSPAPYPAKGAVPEWLKRMPMGVPHQQQNGTEIPTVKQCPPFIEAMACGYIIPLPADVTLSRDAQGGGLTFAAGRGAIETQHPLQYAGTPFEGQLIVKFMSPWTIRTSPGYSTLFLPPLNQFTLPVQVLSGLVETDTYYRPVHFPSICLMAPGTTVTLPRGTPIAQVIPVRREEWQSSVGQSDRQARVQIEQDIAADRHNYYKDRHWKKKGYG